jgi:hypothetical protein
MQARRLFIGYIFYICLSFWMIYIYGLSSLKNLWAPLLWYYLLTYWIYFVWSKVKGRIAIDLFWFFILFLYKSAIYLSLATISIWGFLYYQNNISPAKLPVHTISNWEQTIIFQTMSHIGSESFYKSVVNNIYQYKQSWAVLYYEWVGPWSEENNQDFNKALWIDFAPWLYDNFSKLYWVTAQDNNDFLGLINNLDYNIDLNLDQVMSLYREKVWTWSIENWWILVNDTVHNLNDEVIGQLAALSPRELTVLRYINQGILNFMIKHEWLREFLISKLANQDIFSVILDDRNKHIVQEILARDDEKIIILYGLMHFNWVLELLQADDKSWEIIDTQYLQIITQSS